MKRRTLYLILILSLLSKFSLGQQFFRISADITYKEKSPDGTYNLVMGKVYFDKSVSKIVYNISFPEKEIWLMTDTSITKVANDTIKNREVAYNLVDFSIFNLVINGSLSNYGLNDQVFVLADVEKEDSLVISTYQVNNQKLKEFIGEVILSTKDKRLYGIIFLNKSGDIVSKRFFEDYQSFSGAEFPTKIIHIYYKDGKENYIIQTYQNIKFNETGNDSLYNYFPPVH